MAVPKIGVYVSTDKTIKIQIDQAFPSNGLIKGTYSNQNGPEGPVTYKGEIGRYMWVSSPQHPGGGTAPFCIRFTGFVRPEGRPYCVVDSWNGAYIENDLLLLTGTRAYVNEKGVAVSDSLGRMKFVLAQVNETA